MEKKFVANKAIIVNGEGHVLLLRDAGVGDHANAKGRWDVPGGRMEAHETPQQALVREVKEEIGIEIDSTLARPFHVGLWGVGGDVENNPVVGIFWAIPAGQDKIVISSEHTEMMWVDPLLPLPDEIIGDVRGILAAYSKYSKHDYDVRICEHFNYI